MPALDVDPPDEHEGGLSRVIIETDVPARVERDGLLCESTPCVVALPYGDHELRFQGGPERWSSVVVHVRHPTEVVNHTLGMHHAAPAQGLGVFAAAVGLVVVGVGIALALPNDDGTPSTVKGETTAAIVGGGFGAILLGGVIVAAANGTTRDGATTQWTPTRTIGGSVGLRF
jgi:hypothetical protein